VTDAVPGVSGATMLLLFGIYESVIEQAAGIIKQTPAEIIDSIINIKLKITNEQEFLNLTVLGLGIISGALLMTLTVNKLLNHIPGIVFGFFCGIILGSGVVIFIRDIEQTNIQIISAIATGVLISASISLFSVSLGRSIPILIFTGGIATFGMVLPGISGSFILLIMGQYEYIVGLVSKAVSRNISDSEAVALLAVITGGIIGILINIVLINSQINKNKSSVIGFMTGLVFGGAVAPIREISMLDSPNLTFVIPVGVIGVITVLSIFVLSKRVKD
jgi:putative membrane protein